MKITAAGWPLCLGLLLVGCAGVKEQAPMTLAPPPPPPVVTPKPAPEPAGQATGGTASSAAASKAPAPANGRPAAVAPKDPPPAPPNPADLARAQKLLAQGQHAYHQGEYDRAEQLLKEAVTVYPFLAEANLILGKILLIRASATRDASLVKSARLMFEMAHALDPAAREPALLLELFANPKSE